MPALIAIDIGNSNITIGLLNGSDVTRSWRINTDLQRTADEYRIIIENLVGNGDGGDIKGVVMCSVVPSVTPAIKQAVTDLFGQTPLVVDQYSSLGVEIEYDIGALGSDRVVDALAAFKLYGEEGMPLIVVDVGTCVVFDVIGPRGQYLGGVIAPGIAMSADCLNARTALLPRVELVKPDSVVGKTTPHSVQSGIMFGFIDLVERMLERIGTEVCPTGGKYRVIATGGLAELVANLTPKFDCIDTDLTLKGLAIAHELLKAQVE